MASTTQVFFDIFARDKNVSKVLDNVARKAEHADKKLGGFKGGLNKLAAPAAGVVTAIGGVAFSFGQMAADAEQNVGAVEKVFGKASDKVLGFATDSAGAVGLSSSEYNKLSATTGTALKAAGIHVDKLADQNNNLITRGSDLAAVFGGTTVDAVQAMGSAFRGEFDPLERYGVTLTMNTVNQELARRSQDKLTGAAKEAAKKAAILDLIMQQTAGSAGQFASEADTAAGAQSRATAKFSDAASKLGEKLLPVLLKLADFLSEAATWISKNSDLVAILTSVIAVLAGGIVVLTAVTRIMNLTMLANPIGLVILAVAGLIAVIVLLHLNWDRIVRFLRDKWQGFSNWFRDGMGKMGRQWNDFWGGVGRNARNVWNSTLKPVFDTIHRVVTRNIPEAFRLGVSFIATAWNKIKAVARVPISFVLKLINDGLIGGFNFVAGLLGVGKLAPIRIAGFHDGGYTGDGNEHDIAGAVHKGEYVVDAANTKRLGLNRPGAGIGAMAGSDNYIYGPLQKEVRQSRALRLVPQGGFPVRALMEAAYGWNALQAGVGVGVGQGMSASSVGVGWGHLPGYAVGWYSGRNITVEPGNGMFREVVSHEVGHALGLGHAHGQRSIMDPMLRGGTSVPAFYDKQNLALLYGGGGTGPVEGFGVNPLDGVIGGIIGAINKAFKDGNMVADLAIGIAKKLSGDMINIISKGMGFGATGAGAMSPKVFDDGGWFSEGLGLHRGSQPDAVLTKSQFADLHKLALSGGAGGDIYVQNPWTGEYLKAQMIQVVDKSMRRNAEDVTYRRPGR